MLYSFSHPVCTNNLLVTKFNRVLDIHFFQNDTFLESILHEIKHHFMYVSLPVLLPTVTMGIIDYDSPDHSEHLGSEFQIKHL